MYSICIYSKNNSISPEFVKANSYMSNKLCCSSSKKDFDNLRELWETDWNITIDESWKTLSFQTQRALDLFLLRWS